MLWLQSLDTGLFRFINQSLSNPLFDWLMRWFDGTELLAPFVIVAVAWLLWRWRARGLICAIMIALAVGIGDGVLSKNLKHAIARERPWSALPDVRSKKGGNPNISMPSSHTVNWFAATMVMFLFNRKSLRIMLPLAITVGFSRVYLGYHYPSDVLAGAILGAGEAAALVIILNGAWRRAGQKWFPLWWQRMPSLMDPESRIQNPESSAVGTDSHWLRAGYVLVAALTLFRWLYLASGTIELLEDEAYQWVWSKHLALSYFSKPPLIAYTQFLGTSIWGDTELGVRFFSPLLSCVVGFALLRFFAREVSAKAGFFLVLIFNAVPFAALGTIVMTVDPLSVCFWTLAALAGWRAVQPDSRTVDWLWAGLWMGLGFLSKYTALFQWLCWAIFFVLYAPARAQLRRPGPYLALLINALCIIPVLIWNAQNGWPTVKHVVMENAKLDQPWQPTLKYFFEFVGGEAGLLNPIFFIGIVIAAVMFFRRQRSNALLAFFFSTGAPLYLVYLAWTFHSRVQLNWIAPAIVPLLCFMVIYWNTRWAERSQSIKRWLAAGLVLGWVAVVLMHDTNLVSKIAGRSLPASADPMRRVRGWKDMAVAVAEARTNLLAEGKPVFVIGGHYGTTGELSFYLPGSRERVKDEPIVYAITSDRPANQFYFWPGYASVDTNKPSARRGQNAIYVADTKKQGPAPEILKREFETVTDLGLREIKNNGRTFHTIQLFECRNLR